MPLLIQSKGKDQMEEQSQFLYLMEVEKDQTRFFEACLCAHQYPLTMTYRNHLHTVLNTRLDINAEEQDCCKIVLD